MKEYIEIENPTKGMLQNGDKVTYRNGDVRWVQDGELNSSTIKRCHNLIGYSTDLTYKNRNILDIVKVERLQEKIPCKYHVTVQNGKAPKKQHDTLHKAKEEAKRLAGLRENIGKKVYVQAIVWCCQAEVKVNKVEI